MDNVIVKCKVDGIVGSRKIGRRTLMAACGYSKCGSKCGAPGDYECKHKILVAPDEAPVE